MQLVQCPKCGASISPDARFCSNCGAVAIVVPTRETVGSGPISPLREVITATTYLVHTIVSEAYRSRDGQSGLGVRYQFSSFEFRELSGTLVAISHLIEEGPIPTAATKFASLSSLLSSTVKYSLETAQGLRIGELLRSAALSANGAYLTINDGSGNTVAVIAMRVARKPGGGFISAAVTTWTIETPAGQELARINCGKGNRGWTIENPEGETIAEIQRIDSTPQGYETSHQLTIRSSKLDPYLILATFFATPPGSGGGFHLS